jgi:three-Cys-motif partner protein
MPRDSHFERFEDHTRLKHFLLDSYLKQWASILLRPHLMSPGQRTRLWFVDAFAGAGRDRTGTPGSPLIAAEIARGVNAEFFPAGPTTSSGMHVLAMEVDPQRAKQLEEHLEPFSQKPPFVHVRQGELGEVLSPFLGYVQNDPVLYFLDPFGVEGLDAEMLRNILSAPKAEVLLLFSDEGAVRLAGKASATVPTKAQLLAERQRDPSMFGGEFEEQQAEADRTAVERVLSGHQSNPRAREILNRAFGGEWWQPIIEATPVSQRRERFVGMYEELLRRSGASHVLPFAVTTTAGRHKYTLIHASKHKRAYAAMKEAMHRARRRFGAQTAPSLFDGAAAEPGFMSVEFGGDVAAVVDALTRHFAGRRVRFSGAAYSDESVERFAVDETPLMKHELKALRAELERRGLAVRLPDGRLSVPAEFEFPKTQ